MLIKLQSFIRRCVAGIVSLLLLAGVVIGGANAAFGDSWTYTTHYEWESDTYLFPPIEQTFPLQLGDFQQNQSLAVKSIAKTGAGSGAEKCGITITWEYTANVKKTASLGTLNLGKVNQVQRYFTTTLESGLGQPKITKITKDGQTLSHSGKTSSNNTNLYSTTDLRSGKDLETGKYVYTITTEVIAPRQQYVLNVLTNVTGTYPPGTILAISGKPQFVEKDEQITVPSAFAYPLDMTSNQLLHDCAGNTPQVKSFVGDGVNVAGSYDPHNSQQIKWSYSYVNSSGTAKDHIIALDLDSSHQLRNSTLYYYQPDTNGYKIVKNESVSGTTVKVPALKPGWMVQLVADTQVIDEYASHTFAQATLAAQKANLEVRKVWDRSVKEAEKVDTHFTVSYYAKKNTERTVKELIIPKGKESTILPAVDVFNPQGYRIRYEVSEAPITGMQLYNQVADDQKLRYIFYNEKLQEIDETPQADTPQCGGTKTFGVTSLNFSDHQGTGQINQFLYNSNSYGWGSKLTGNFTIPANAGDGDYFTLRIPPELKLNALVDSNKPLGTLTASINGANKQIGKFYLINSDLISFKLNNNAQHSSSYNGTFSIGWDTNKSIIKRVNGNSYDGRTTYSWGFEPGFGAAYDVRNHNQTYFTKTLRFNTEYIGLNNSAVPCHYHLEKPITFHFEDNEIYEMLKYANKYVIEETEDSLTYRLVFNAAGDTWLRQKWFYDRLTNTIDLYHGNTQDALYHDLKIYQGDPIRSGGVVSESLKELWPAKSATADPGLNITDVVIKPVNFSREGYTRDGSRIQFHHEFYAGVSGHSNQTIVFDVKTRKKAPASDGFYYNEANFYVSGGSFKYVINNNRYRATRGMGTASFGNTYNVSFMKVDEKGLPIKGDPASFYLKSKQDGVYSSKAATDANGIVTFQDVIPAGKKGDSSQSNGEYELVEIKAPNGYQTAAKMDLRITLDRNNQPQITYQGKQYPAVLNNHDFSKLFQVKNQPIPALQISKVDAITHAPLPGAVLKLTEYDLSKYNFGANTQGNPLRTLMLGCADLENTTLTACENLQVDKFRLPHTRANRLYVLEEITAPTGYDRLTEKIYIKATANAQTQKIEFAQVDSRGQNAKTLQFDADTASFTYQLPNKRINRIEFMKQDATGNPIHDPKAKFQLYQQQQNGKKNITLQNGATIKADTYGKEANIVNSSSFRYSSLPDGIYYLLETVAPQGMITPKYPVAVFHVKQGTVYSDAQDNKVAIKNYRLGRFKVIKTDDAAKPQKMQGVGFTLYQDPDFARKVGVEKKTNDLGVLYFTDLEAGTYYLKETTVPKGYKAAKPLKVVVTPEGKTLVEQPAGAAQPITVTDAAHAAAAGTGTTPASAAANPLDLTNKLGTLHQKDPKFPNGNTQRVTINSGVRPEAQDIFLNQEIVPAGAPNTYQVNATISGAGMVNQRVATDVLIMLERRKQGVDMYGDGNFYRDQISKHIIQPLQAKLPAGSRISVHVWGTDAVYRNVSNSEVMPFTDIQNANAVFMQNSGKLNYATDWHTRHFYYPDNEKYGFSKIILETMNKSNQNSRRVVVSYAGHGLNDYKHNPSIFASEWNNNDSANFHQPQNKTYLREIMRDYEFYSFEEAGAQGRTRHLNPKFDPNDPSSPQYTYEYDGDRWMRFTPLGDEFYTIGEAVGVQESHMLQATSYFEEIKDAVDSGQYSLQLQKIADMIGSENGKLELKLSNNVIFDAAKSLKAGTNKIEFKSIGLLKPGNGKDPEISYNQATGMIEGKNFQVSPVNGGKANPSITFSYYLKAKAEAAELNKYQPINSFARYNAGINSGGVQMLPIPQVKIPGAIYTLNRQWHHDVSESDKNRQTLVSLIRKDNKGTAVVQSKIYKSEANTAFEAVPVYDENGIAFEYSIVENGLPEYLGTEMQYNNQTGYTAIKGADVGTQMRTPVKLYVYPRPVEYAVRKLWENTPAEQRKAVTLQLQGHIGEQAVNLTELGVAATTVELNNSKNFVHVFKNLPALKEGQKIRYSVIETALDGKAINPEEFQAQYAYSNTSATITNIKTSEVTIVNKHANYLKILKRDAETGVVQPLNARFEIQKLTADGSSADPNYRYAGWTYQNNNDGLAINHDTPAGKYRLTELIAPAGYEKIAAPIVFEIPAKYTSEIVINKFAKLSYDTATHTYLLTMTNNRITEIPGRFPLTGDIGIWIYIGIGAIIATIAIIWLRRRTRVQEE